MKRIKWLVLLFVFVFIVGFVIYKNDILMNKTKNDKDIEENEILKKVDEVISEMTIEEKIGQMLIIYHNGSVVNDSFNSFLDKVKPGGIILMRENFTNYQETSNFVKDFKETSDIPMIVSVDQEGGRVQRLLWLSDGNATDVPDMLSLGKTLDETLAYNVGKLMAEEMRTIGVNVVYAPVLDVFSNPDNKVIGNRSFSSDVNIVTKMALSLAKGLEESGVIATYKHFPGHGDTSVDSHTSLPIINKTYEELDSLELIPYKSAIKSGAKIIMLGHIAYPSITGDNIPVTMSKKIVTDMLKDKLGFDGLVITDALNMKALTSNYSYEEIVLNTINAGVDFLLIPKNEEETIKLIKENISEERINESVKKILYFKFKYLSEDNTLDRTYLGSEEHKKIIENISE